VEQFISRIKAHIDHVKRVGEHCSTEETTKQALILPLLDILGFSPYDPTKVLAEYAADFPGVKASERVDYALYSNGKPVMFIEAKPYAANLSNHAPQLSRYFNCTPDVTMAAITNGREWRFFTDLHNTNIMDEKPFLTVDFTKNHPEELTQLMEFMHDNFHPEKLRGFAEENQYIQQFKDVIKSSIKDVDIDFVRYVAQRASIPRQLNTKFLETIQPYVKQALEQSISDMVVKGLSSPTVVTAQPVVPENVEAAPAIQIEPEPDFVVDPHNPKIVTTKDELNLLRIIKEILPEENLIGKDTESYYSVLYQGKNNRWLVRYDVNRKRHTIQFNIDMDGMRREEVQRAGLTVLNSGLVYLDRPEDILRAVGIIKDALEFCKDDDNFKRQQG
jgi:predicted type IV restriction endonuclease